MKNGIRIIKTWRKWFIIWIEVVENWSERNESKISCDKRNQKKLRNSVNLVFAHFESFFTYFYLSWNVLFSDFYQLRHQNENQIDENGEELNPWFPMYIMNVTYSFLFFFIMIFIMYIMIYYFQCVSKKKKTYSFLYINTTFTTQRKQVHQKIKHQIV